MGFWGVDGSMGPLSSDSMLGKDLNIKELGEDPFRA